MSKEEARFYWNLTGECFAGNKLGADVTAHFLGDKDRESDIDKNGNVKKDSRLYEYIKVGAIVDKQPDSFEEATDAELNKLRETVKEQEVKIADLERDLAKTPGTVKKANAKIKKLEAKLKDMPEGVEESAKTIEDLEKKAIELDVDKDNLMDQVTELTKTIEELTAPDEGGK